MIHNPDATRRIENRTFKPSEKIDKEIFVPWPEDVPKQRNACTDYCDMWTGPCCCGAWHTEGK